MAEGSAFTLPVITDGDIEWVCALLGLPATAFAGADGMDPRLEVLKSTASLDIEACPGSGKTTLLVAKLAILARKWTDPRRGICVLSHTNVARREIEARLGNTAAGQRLLSYPHYVGTIHGFVNEFLAIPWLRSRGYPIRAIDSALCEKHRRRLLATAQFSALANWVRPKEAVAQRVNVVGEWRVATPEFQILRNGNPEFKDQTGPAARQLVALARKCATDGYHCYDEMFMWAHDLLDSCPWMIPALRARFPSVFIDEVQDNSESQSKILSRLFVEGVGPAVRQRYGDSNQAIYDSVKGSGATTDTFPLAAICKTIPNSHRFGNEIAAFADPLALSPHSLVGCGPQDGKIASDANGRHTVFLFDDSSLEHVIEAYARHLCDIFSSAELGGGVFTAVAAVHKPGESDDNVPRHIGKYWPAYDPSLTSAEPKPDTLQQYFAAGAKLAAQYGEAHFATEKIAEGIFRLAQIADPLGTFGAGKRKHRQLLDLLSGNHQLHADYLRLITTTAVDRVALTQAAWEETWLPAIIAIVKTIAGGAPDNAGTREFVAWSERAPEQNDTPPAERDNLFRYPVSSPNVKIRVGSIHSVKGETHTATLVLDSFAWKHHLASLKPWLIGQKSGRGREGPQNCQRLKQHYVAMTRPTHLLCLALREDALTTDDMQLLRDKGWKLARVRAGGHEWIP